jgi:transposase InsO family protein
MNLQQKVIKNKLGLLNLAEELGNVSRACKVLGFSRDTFYRYRELVDQGGAEFLIEKTRRKPNPLNRVANEVEQAVLDMALQMPALGQCRVADQLRVKGIMVSPGTIHNIWKRHGINTFQLRLRQLEVWAKDEGIVLTEEQKIALEKKRDDDAACGEIETVHPGYLGSQDTFYIGNLKGVGRMYQQTFVDTYSKVAICKLYTAKNALTAADLLNDRVVPFFEAENASLLRVLTDRGTEYCGLMDSHPYQLYLATCEIEHTRTKAYSPQTNGICERFHRTVLEEFYRVAFRKKVYTALSELQADLDEWLKYYNEERTHQGKKCCGRTPMTTFRHDLATWIDTQRELNLEP